MYGDTEVMRRRAAQLREQAADLRTLADRLVAQTDAAGWEGRAAEALRVRIRERAGRLRTAAARHDAAAESLGTHLLEVERLQDLIAAQEEQAADLDPATFTAPPPGHRSWLTTALPERTAGDRA